MSSSQYDKRRAERLELNTPPDTEVYWLPQDFIPVNVSKYGIRLRTTHPLEPFQPIQLSILKKTLIFFGEVRWCAPSQDNGYEVGVQLSASTRNMFQHVEQVYQQLSQHQPHITSVVIILPKLLQTEIIGKYFQNVDMDLKFFTRWDELPAYLEKQEVDLVIGDDRCCLNHEQLIQYHQSHLTEIPTFLLAHEVSKELSLHQSQHAFIDIAQRPIDVGDLAKRCLQLVSRIHHAPPIVDPQGTSEQIPSSLAPKDTIHKDLKVAYQIILELFEAQQQQVSHLDYSITFEPYQELGGDFFNVFPVSPRSYGFLLGDVMGHGIPAAFISIMLHTYFNNFSLGLPSPSIVLNYINAIAVEKIPGGRHASVCYAIYDEEEKKLHYTNAGHHEIILIQDKLVSLLPTTKDPLLGMFSNEVFGGFHEKHVDLNSGDIVLMFTDALLEVHNSENQMLELEGVANFLQEQAPFHNIQDITRSLFQYGKSFSPNNAYDDDCTIVAFRAV